MTSIVIFIATDCHFDFFELKDMGFGYSTYSSPFLSLSLEPSPTARVQSSIFGQGSRSWSINSSITSRPGRWVRAPSLGTTMDAESGCRTSSEVKAPSNGVENIIKLHWVPGTSQLLVPQLFLIQILCVDAWPRFWYRSFAIQEWLWRIDATHALPSPVVSGLWWCWLCVLDSSSASVRIFHPTQAKNNQTATNGGNIGAEQWLTKFTQMSDIFLRNYDPTLPYYPSFWNKLPVVRGTGPTGARSSWGAPLFRRWHADLDPPDSHKLRGTCQPKVNQYIQKSSKIQLIIIIAYPIFESKNVQTIFIYSHPQGMISGISRVGILTVGRALWHAGSAKSAASAGRNTPAWEMSKLAKGMR